MENLCKGCEIAKIYCVKLSKGNVSFSVYDAMVLLYCK